MGFSVSASFAIIMVAVLAAATDVVMEMESNQFEYRDSSDRRVERQLARLQTALEIEAWSYNNTTGHLTVQVVNTGEQALRVAQVDLLVNGQLAPRVAGTSSVDGNGDTALWYPGELLELTVATDASLTLQSLRVISGNGVTATLIPGGGGG